MFKSMKRIIKWAGKYKGRLYLGSVFSFFSSLSTAIPTMAAAYALDKAIAAYWAGNHNRILPDLADALDYCWLDLRLTFYSLICGRCCRKALVMK